MVGDALFKGENEVEKSCHLPYLKRRERGVI